MLGPLLLLGCATETHDGSDEVKLSAEVKSVVPEGEEASSRASSASPKADQISPEAHEDNESPGSSDEATLQDADESADGDQASAQPSGDSSSPEAPTYDDQLSPPRIPCQTEHDCSINQLCAAEGVESYCLIGARAARGPQGQPPPPLGLVENGRAEPSQEQP